jgi:hypothetical protein
VSSCSRIRSMASKMTSTSTGARSGKGRSGNSRLGFPFCISLASVGGSALHRRGRDRWSIDGRYSSTFRASRQAQPELAWSNSIHTYSAMRTDAQIASLLLAFTLPIRRYRWYIAPSGAGDEVVEDVANEQGVSPVPVRPSMP